MRDAFLLRRSLGGYTGMASKRDYTICLRGIWLPSEVIYNGQTIVHQAHDTAENGLRWRYDGNQVTTIIHLPAVNVFEITGVEVRMPDYGLQLLDSVPGKLARLRNVMNLLNKYATKTKDWSPDSLVTAVQTGNRISLWPDNALAQLEKLNTCVPRIIQEVMPVEGDSGTEKPIGFVNSFSQS